MAKLSVVITAHNNQNLILDCIKSVRFADEILVIDNESTDDTVSVAKKAGAKVISHKNDPTHLNASKNFGFKKASGDWILSLDSDERIEKPLQEEIKGIISDETNQSNGFLIPRKNIIFGKWIRHGLWYPDHQLRLFRNGKGRFPNIHNHEMLELEGKPSFTKGHMLHYNYNTISQYIQKIDKQYSDNEAQTFLDRGNKIHWYDAIRFPFQDFLSNYFAREAYKDGLHGLVLSIMQAFYMFVVFAKIWEKQGFKEKDISLDETQQEFKRARTQLRHWFVQSKSQSSKPLYKLYLKITSKIS